MDLARIDAAAGTSLPITYSRLAGVRHDFGSSKNATLNGLGFAVGSELTEMLPVVTSKFGSSIRCSSTAAAAVADAGDVAGGALGVLAAGTSVRCLPAEAARPCPAEWAADANVGGVRMWMAGGTAVPSALSCCKPWSLLCGSSGGNPPLRRVATDVHADCRSIRSGTAYRARDPANVASYSERVKVTRKHLLAPRPVQQHAKHELSARRIITRRPRRMYTLRCGVHIVPASDRKHSSMQ